MRFGQRCFLLIIFIFLSVPVYADGTHRVRHLTQQEIQRVKAVKELLQGVDTKSLQETIDELEKSRHPLLNLQIKEAMAKAYTDIVKEINVVDEKRKEWLYSMVNLNMAYLQFGGAQGKYGSTTELNRLIRKKLKEYLPPHLLERLGSAFSLE